MARPEKIQSLIDAHEGKLPEHSGLGHYSVMYLCKDGGVICAKCANENLKLTDDPDDPQWYITDIVSEFENPIDCDNCYEEVPVLWKVKPIKENPNG